MLDACDRVGMLVMDETFDMWTSAKSDFDYSLDFPQWWERDIEAMVAKDVNHPSVILYSIGNEIPETGSPIGSTWGRRLAEKVRALDGTRYVTNGVNGMVAMLGDLAAMRAQASERRRGQHDDGRRERGAERDRLLQPGNPADRRVVQRAGRGRHELRRSPVRPGPGPVPQPDHRRHARPSPPASTATGSS